MKLIDDWSLWWRFASVWASGVGFSVLTVWTIMPPAVRDVVPDWIEVIVGAALFAFVLLARVTDQPKIREKRDGQDA